MNRRRLTLITASALLLVLVLCWPVLAAEGAGGKSAFRHWWDIIWRVLNFVILAYLIYRLAKGPTKKFFASQREKRSEELEDLERAKREAAAAHEATLAKLADLPVRIKELEDQFAGRCDRIREAEIERARVEADLILGRARDAAATTFREAEVELRAEVVDMAAAEAERVIREIITDTDHDRLVNEYVSQVAPK